MESEFSTDLLVIEKTYVNCNPLFWRFSEEDFLAHNCHPYMIRFTLHDTIPTMQVGQIMDGISETQDKSSGEPSANQTPMTNAANVDNGQRRSEKKQVNSFNI
ncbi:hypothetical protein DdX_10518 [Ditylenchus destructor]|uniref:Uncharacterized protein n=1 Tax=Ditylenchus destructor TaxID=166010 RepID=A0AAD4R5F4_9BILA|nr:hypothetical protein DdX_10518 [Ditylenchus destructor]